MEFVLSILGLALIVVLVYLALSGTPVPPALKVVILIAVALMFLLCILHAAGCQIPRPPELR